jgi:Tfp pilus assembly protein PilX
MLARSRNRPGFALAVALAAIVIIGAIITGMFFTSTQEYRISRNTALQARALTAAEYGMNSIVGTGQWQQGGTRA